MSLFIGIFSFNSYVCYLTHGFIASNRTFNLLARASNLPARVYGVPTRVFNLATRAFSLLIRETSFAPKLLSKLFLWSWSVNYDSKITWQDSNVLKKFRNINVGHKYIKFKYSRE